MLLLLLDPIFDKKVKKSGFRILKRQHLYQKNNNSSGPETCLRTWGTRSNTAALVRRVAEIGASLRPSLAGVTAQQRLEQVHQRVKARLAAAGT